MELLHEELRRAREKAGLSQQTLANLAGIPRNQVVRAERGENITLDTLRKLAAHLPVTELTLLDTTGFRVDIFAEPEKLYLSAMENVVRLNEALRVAVEMAMQARTAMEISRRAAPPLPGEERQPAMGVDALLLLRNLRRLSGELDALGKDAQIAS